MRGTTFTKMKTKKQILDEVSKRYKQENFDYALRNCLISYLHQIVEEAMKEYANQFKKP